MLQYIFEFNMNAIVTFRGEEYLSKHFAFIISFLGVEWKKSTMAAKPLQASSWKRTYT